ncbi:MAG TPA: GNAT family N-acetyltransferase [Solirubrobacteraceae bacterium]
MDAMRLARDFERRTIELTADEFVAIGCGFLVTRPSQPQVWSLNHLRITQPVTLQELEALADEHLSSLPYRHVVLEHEPTGRLLEDPLRDAGWRVEREVVMELRRPPDQEIDTSMVIEAGEEEMLALMARWHLEGPEQVSDAGLHQLYEHGRRENRALRDRNFAIRSPDGGLAAITKLRQADGVAQLEDVYAAPEHRGRGYGRALVTHAAAVARAGDHQLRFIVADDNDWPKLLYGKVGFDPIGWTWSVHRSPGS